MHATMHDPVGPLNLDDRTVWAWGDNATAI